MEVDVSTGKVSCLSYPFTVVPDVHGNAASWVMMRVFVIMVGPWMDCYCDLRRSYLLGESFSFQGLGSLFSETH